ncbi:hypothetical protein MRX96_036178 [Rhipicephalus microplus]
MLDMYENVVRVSILPESDLAMGPFFPASERLEIAKPSTVFYMEQLRILAGRESSQQSSVFGYIMAFDWMASNTYSVVWMFLSVALIIMSVVTALLNHVKAYKSQKRMSFIRSITDATWMYVENLFLEATAEPVRGGAQRLLSAVWWLATLVLMNAFCGHMRACLMIKSEVRKIESAEDLVDRPQTVPYMWLGTSYVATVANSTNPDQRRIGRTIRERGTAVPVQELYGRALLEKVAQGRAAIISDATSLAFQVSSKCQDFVGAEYYMAREGLVSHPLNSFARKDIDPELFKNINKIIRRLLEAGLVNYWWGIAMGDMGPCGGGLVCVFGSGRGVHADLRRRAGSVRVVARGCAGNLNQAHRTSGDAVAVFNRKDESFPREEISDVTVVLKRLTQGGVLASSLVKQLLSNMVPCTVVPEHSETAKSAISPNLVLSGEPDDRVVYTEELPGASGHPAEISTPRAEDVVPKPCTFAGAAGDGTSATTETKLGFEVDASADAPQDGVTAAQASGPYWAPSLWVTVPRGASTITDYVTVNVVQNPMQVVFQVEPNIVVCNGLWPTGLDYSQFHYHEDNAPSEKRRLTRSVRNARRKRAQRRAYKLASGEDESGCEADSEPSTSEGEKGDDDDDNGNEQMASLSLW